MKEKQSISPFVYFTFPKSTMGQFCIQSPFAPEREKYWKGPIEYKLLEKSRVFLLNFCYPESLSGFMTQKTPNLKLFRYYCYREVV